ncbi:hypothetical protein CAPTEDRAFT_202956 [Capitella teleta]|uniref:Protein kinase domain-containing protein n=1 Tax=Capitella teleta TaxID=283909 RepID=R7U701_CAPTE|nr:hypothetical protein CAPTEDRAFT_202956 [Capitella teleta]|eukprot:ELT99441.1 hypothetical protein CAPTEDRAFT_202956 [Capitella teleta]
MTISEINRIETAIFAYKWKFSLLPTLFDRFFSLRSDTHSRQTRSAQTFNLIKCRTETRKRSLAFRAAALLNRIYELNVITFSTIMRYDGCTTDIDDTPYYKPTNVGEKYFFYEDKTLGHGATSEVHLGRNKLSFIAGVQITITVTHKQKTGEHVAVKVVKKNFAPHTKRETELLESLKHENIVKLIAVETDGVSHQNSHLENKRHFSSRKGHNKHHLPPNSGLGNSSRYDRDTTGKYDTPCSMDVPDDHDDHDDHDNPDDHDDHDDPDDPDGHTDRNDYDDSRDDSLDKEPDLRAARARDCFHLPRGNQQILRGQKANVQLANTGGQKFAENKEPESKRIHH